MANKDRAAVQSGLNDLLGSVIQSDQRSAGRAQKEPVPVENTGYSSAPGHDPGIAVPDTADIMTIRHYDNKTNKQEDKQTNMEGVPPETEAASAKRHVSMLPASTETLVEKRLEEVVEMAATATMTVTLRIPAAFNEWLDEYVHRSWPKKVKKQELVIEALHLLFVRRGRPGEEILDSDLIPKKTP